MSTPIALLEPATHEVTERMRTLRAAINSTVTAYYEKEEEQAIRLKKINETLQMLRRQRKSAPARSAEDDPSLYDEGQSIPTLIKRLLVSSPQTTRPVYRVYKQWAIPDLKRPLCLTEAGTLTRQTPSVVKARSMQEEIPLDHPWVMEQFDDISRGLDAMRFALREV